MTHDPAAQTSSGLPAWVVRLWQDRALRTGLVLFLLLRLLTGLVAVVGVDPAHPVGAPFYQMAGDPGADRATDTYGGVYPAGGLLRALTWPWFVWDTHYYVSIASAGYDVHPRTAVFPPLYPALIAGVGGLSGDDVLAAILVGNAACLLMIVLLIKLVAAETGDEQAARWSAIWLLAFPTAYYFFAPYTESLFLALVLGAWLAARGRRYWLGGVLACLAALTRTQGLVLVAPFGYMVLRASGIWAEGRVRLERLPALLKATPLLLGAPLGWGLHFAGSVALGYGSPAAVMRDAWFIQTLWPWDAVAGNLQMMVQTGITDVMDVFNPATLLAAALLLLPVLRRLPLEYALYSLGTLAVILTRLPDVLPFTSASRYVLTVFPLFIVIALLLRPPEGDSRWRRLARFGLLELSLLCQVVLLAKYVRWIFIA
ncbi:MAG: hypothetical protein JW910_19195 [Anaerolineae bacterium]|nr:hypothetical protein [Anaerolineae bacterium]